MAIQIKLSFMKDIIRLPSDLGHAIKQARKRGGMKATEIARHSGRSRDVLNRLERGEDVTVASLMAILGAMGLVIKLERAGLPSLAEMRESFGNLDEVDSAP
jgi:HTH-type transcriptional regulator/antitoxin HipB